VPTFRSSHERRGGYQEGLAEHGVTLAPEYDMEGAYTFESGFACAEKLMRMNPRPTAIFAANDEMATGVLQAARHAGVKVPEELSVVGFDDFQLAERVWPALTTVHTPTREVGRMAALKLIRAGRETEEPPPPEPDRTVPYLVVRESSSPPGA
jgi:LacI family transcriptional regulator